MVAPWKNITKLRQHSTRRLEGQENKKIKRQNNKIQMHDTIANTKKILKKCQSIISPHFTKLPIS